MITEHINQLRLKVPRVVPSIEFDPVVTAWYIRFSKTNVAKTISDDRPGYVCAIDLDAKNEVVGIELLGVQEFSIKPFREMVAPFGVDLSGADFENARYRSAARAAHAEAKA